MDRLSQDTRQIIDAYRSGEAAGEYYRRHRKSWARRCVSRREERTILALLRTGLDRAPDHGTARDGRGPCRILDVPCGAGRLSCRLSATGYSVFPFDSSLDMLERGIDAGFLVKDRTVEGSIFSLPFEDNAFDGSCCLRFMHHLESGTLRKKVFGELRRVTRGPLVASFWSGSNLQRLRRKLKRALLGRRRSARYCLSTATIVSEAHCAGWRLVEKRHLFRFVSETTYYLFE